jgi:hypothetical protein
MDARANDGGGRADGGGGAVWGVCIVSCARVS